VPYKNQLFICTNDKSIKLYTLYNRLRNFEGYMIRLKRCGECSNGYGYEYDRFTQFFVAFCTQQYQIIVNFKAKFSFEVQRASFKFDLHFYNMATAKQSQ
jgi:hypothetical protein